VAEEKDRPSPTEGQRANTVGKFYVLSPGQFDSPEEYAKARDEAYDKWRDSLKTKEDYERETGELLPHLYEGDKFQRFNARTALDAIIGDSQSKGIGLSPQTEQALGAANLGQLSEIMSAFAGGRSGRLLAAARRRPGQKPEGDQKQPAVTGNNVRVLGKEDCNIKPYSKQKCPKGQQAHHIVPDYTLRYGTRKDKNSRIPGMPSLNDGPTICLEGNAKTNGTEHSRAHAGTDPGIDAAGKRADNSPPGTAPIEEILQISIEGVAKVKPHCTDEVKKSVNDAFKGVKGLGSTIQAPGSWPPSKVPDQSRMPRRK